MQNYKKINTPLPSSCLVETDYDTSFSGKFNSKILLHISADKNLLQIKSSCNYNYLALIGCYLLLTVPITSAGFLNTS